MKKFHKLVRNVVLYSLDAMFLSASAMLLCIVVVYFLVDNLVLYLLSGLTNRAHYCLDFALSYHLYFQQFGYKSIFPTIWK